MWAAVNHSYNLVTENQKIYVFILFKYKNVNFRELFNDNAKPPNVLGEVICRVITVDIFN